MLNKPGCFLVLVSALAISACTNKEGIAPGPVPIAAPTAGSVTTRTALDLMGSGEEAQAREILETILASNPGDRTARKYLDQIIVDPVKLLGAQNYRYRVQSGDTMASIARNTLGDSSQFYALSRYNGISDPRKINAGQILKIPGTEPKAKKPEPVAKPVVRERPAPPPSDASTSNPKLATQLRAEGLAALNRGAIARAVSLLTQASRHDPSNQTIAADLARAKRIQATVSN
jgi:LysM repeat protein